ncbi:MAG: TfoX/Sxy family protein [Pseudomonadota bacterium]
MRLRDMRGLGPKTESILKEIGINSPEELRALGAMRTFLRLKAHQGKRPSLAFLYALVGAIEDRDWLEVARDDRRRLLVELDGIESMESLWKETSG